MAANGFRLGIDLDGVVSDVSAGWIQLHREEFGRDLPSIFRHLEPFPTAVDTFRWLADNAIPTRDVHVSDKRFQVECDIDLDDSPQVLPDLIENRPGATVCRIVRPWNRPLQGATDVGSCQHFFTIVTRRSSRS